MVVIHLDTSFLIRSLEPDSVEDRSLRAWLGGGRSLAMSTVGWSEFLCGPLSPDATQLAARVVTDLIPFGENEAEIAAMLFNQSGRRRGSMVDCMLAATALSGDAPLATSNAKDFGRLESLGLRLVSLD